MKRKKSVLSILLIVGLSCLHSAVLAAPTALEQLMAFSRIKTVQADFIQEQNLADGRMGRLRGRFWMAQPGKFRWEYRVPYQQLINSDGNKVWFFDPDLNQVIIRSQAQAIGDKPALLLSDPKAAQSYFILKNVVLDPARFPAVSSGEKLEWVEAKPKSREASIFSSILIGFSDGKPQKLILTDAFNSQTIITFSKMALNQAIGAQQFTFEPPKGVDILKDSL